MVGEWYYNFYKSKKNMYEFTLYQISQYELIASQRYIAWTLSENCVRVSVTKLKIYHPKGDVFHALKRSEKVISILEKLFYHYQFWRAERMEKT